MAYPAHKPKALDCTGNPVTDQDDGNIVDSGAGVADLAAWININFSNEKAEALKQQTTFLNQPCPKDCERKASSNPLPVTQVLSCVPTIKGGGVTFAIKAKTTWTASVTCGPKAKEIEIKTGTGKTAVVCAVARYECIDGFFWVSLYTVSGNVLLSREKTSQTCPGDVKEYSFATECVDGFWWVIVKDPDGKAVQKQKTLEKCG